MAAIAECVTPLVCCHCGSKLTLPNPASDSSYGRESIRCLVCGIIGHRVKRCD